MCILMCIHIYLRILKSLFVLLNTLKQLKGDMTVTECDKCY